MRAMARPAVSSCSHVSVLAPPTRPGRTGSEFLPLRTALHAKPERLDGYGSTAELEQNLLDAIEIVNIYKFECQKPCWRCNSQMSVFKCHFLSGRFGFRQGISEV